MRSAPEAGGNHSGPEQGVVPEPERDPHVTDVSPRWSEHRQGEEGREMQQEELGYIQGD